MDGKEVLERTNILTIWKWTTFALLGLGLWLIAAPLTFTIESHQIYYSDIVSGFLLCIFALLALYTNREWPLWLCAAAGIWLQFAPLIFWAPNAISYLNDTLVGFLAIAFSVIVPEKTCAQTAETPPGWSFNPSSWVQRLPIIALCFVCWLMARYMAAYQLGYLKTIYDPFSEREH